MRVLYPWVWLAWLGMFGLWEGLALGSGHPEWTLSDYVWRLEQVGSGWSALRYLVAAFCVWLALHMIFGWFR